MDMHNPAPATEAFTVGQITERLKVSRDTIYDAIRDGRLVARKFGKRTLVLASDLEAFLASLPRAGGAVG